MNDDEFLREGDERELVDTGGESREPKVIQGRTRVPGTPQNSHLAPAL